MDIEPLSLIVLIFMVAMLLFQKWVLVFFKRVYEYSVDFYKYLMIVCGFLSIIFLPKLIILLFLNDRFYLNFIGYSLGFFIILFTYKLWYLLITSTSTRSILGVMISMLFIFLLIWIFESRKYLSHEGPTFIDMLIIAVFFINWLDFTVRPFRDIRRLRKVKQPG